MPQTDMGDFEKTFAKMAEEKLGPKTDKVQKDDNDAIDPPVGPCPKGHDHETAADAFICQLDFLKEKAEKGANLLALFNYVAAMANKLAVIRMFGSREDNLTPLRDIKAPAEEGEEWKK